MKKSFIPLSSVSTILVIYPVAIVYPSHPTPDSLFLLHSLRVYLILTIKAATHLGVLQQA